MPKGIYTPAISRGRPSTHTEEQKQESIDRHREMSRIYARTKHTKLCVSCNVSFTSELYTLCKDCREKKTKTKIPKVKKEKESLKADYTKCKIYKIVSPTSNRIYIGSTARPMKIRFNQHKYAYEKWKKNPLLSCCTSRFVFETSDECYVEILQELVCKNRLELKLRECEAVLNNLNCVVNKQHTWTQGVGNSNPVFD